MRAPALSILHVDMDAFFAAVEVLDNPALAGRPLIVGGQGARGVVASCSYEARRFGIRSAMSSVQARRQCPAAVFVDGRHDRYGEVSQQIHEVFHRFTPLVEGISLDEAFLDVGGADRLLGPAPKVAAEVRQAIWAETGLCCSVGVARTKFLAKLASEAAKPVADRQGIRAGPGVFVVRPEEELAFLHPLPIEALWGVGPATAARLRNLGLGTVGDLAATAVDTLERAIGKAAGRHLHNLAHAIDDRRVEPDRALKSVGHEETYGRDCYDLDELRREVVRMSDSVASRLRKAGVVGRTVQLKIRFGDFTTITRARTVPVALDTAQELERIAQALLAAVDLAPGVRLLGVSVSSLQPAGASVPTQLAFELDGPPPAEPRPGWQAATSALDAVRQRFGDQAVGPAALLQEDGLRLRRRSGGPWGPGAEPSPPPSS